MGPRNVSMAIALLLPLFAGCAAPDAAGSEEPEALRWITIDELGASLPPAPIAVGFDVDDTLLFSSPGIYYGLNNVDGPDGSNRFGPEPLSNQEFWATLNRELDAFSLPKRSARELIELHAGRGDEIWFITARPGSDDEALTALLGRTFGLVEPNPVVFMAFQNKNGAIAERELAIYYGDSDGDIEDGLAAGARAIRVLRARNSTHPQPPSPGIHGEEILVDSDR